MTPPNKKTGGFAVESPQDFAARIYALMQEGGGSTASSTTSSSTAAAEVVEPEVL